MKHRYVALAFGTALLLGGLGVWLYQTHDASQKSPNGAQATAEEDARPIGNQPSGEAAGLLDARSDAQYLAAVSRSKTPVGEQAYLQLKLAEICEQSPSVTSKPLSESNKVVKSFRETFCPTYSGSLATAQAALYALPGSDSFAETYGMAAELFDSLASEGSRAESKLLTEQLEAAMTAKDPGFEAVVAAEALQASGQPSKEIARLAETRGLSLGREDLTAAQLVGTQMRMCAKYGGCGPNQLLTIQICHGNATCTSGGSADSNWRRANSPAVYELARQFARR